MSRAGDYDIPSSLFRRHRDMSREFSAHGAFGLLEMSFLDVIYFYTHHGK